MENLIQKIEERIKTNSKRMTLAVSDVKALLAMARRGETAYIALLLLVQEFGRHPDDQYLEQAAKVALHEDRRTENA